MKNIGFQRFSRLVVTLLITAVAVACGQYRSPITEEPTRHIDGSLVGDWLSNDQKIRIKVRKLDGSNYVVTYNGIVFQAFHSDVSGVSFLSVQELETTDRSFTYLAYRTSEGGTKLHLRVVNKEIVPDDAQDSAAIRALLKQNLNNPLLFHTEAVFTREQRLLS
jgi:hypothetical protein